MPDLRPAQSHASLQIATPLGADALLLQTLGGEEHLSAPFRFDLTMQAAKDGLDLGALVGEAAAVTLIAGDGKRRLVHGIVAHATRAGPVWTAELRPWLWLLSLSRGCRIYQNKTIPDIVKEVFTRNGFVDHRQDLSAKYTPIDYCVQYNETDFDFVSRLLEEAGIAYFFEHSATAHTLVLVDDASGHPACPGIDALPYKPLAPSRDWLQDARIDSLTAERRVTAHRCQADDFNFETPATDLKVDTGAGKRTLYEYPGGYAKRDAGEQVVRRRLEALEAEAERVSGASPVRSLAAGHTFTMTGHPDKALNGSYVVLSVWHEARANEYRNSFAAQPAARPFRPPRQTPKPAIFGAQTAIVVGPQGQEVWTDRHGRIKVQFHWDQDGKGNENSSCWVRVAQSWAGKSWGAFVLPRIGQEVVVSFLDGDPDRPIVTGCVYNGDNPVPYALPDEQTRTTLKSNTSMGGGGFNELRFEDKKGGEEVFLHAQKDMTVAILNDRTQTIGHDDATTVRNDRTVTVSEGKDALTVAKGARTVAVETGNETHTNGADFTHTVKGNFTLSVDGDIAIKASGSIVINAGGALTVKSGAGLMLSGGTSLTATAGTALTLSGGTTMELKGSAAGAVDGGGLLTVKGGLVKIN
jgi:type VI secretion system secreted protein VgrG